MSFIEQFLILQRSSVSLLCSARVYTGGKKDYLYMPVVAILWIFFFKSCFLEICGSKEFLVFCKNKLISLGLQRNVLNLLLKCLDHFKFQSQKNKKTQLSLLSVLFFLSCWFYGCVEWQFGYGIYPPFFKGSNHGTHFPVSVIITGAEDVVMAFSRSETEDRRQ